MKPPPEGFTPESGKEYVVSVDGDEATVFDTDGNVVGAVPVLDGDMLAEWTQDTALDTGEAKP